MKAPKEIYTDGENTYATLPVFSNINSNIKYIRADLAELTWEDIKRINGLMVETANKFNHLEVFTEKFFVEVLRRFNKEKQNKRK